MLHVYRQLCAMLSVAPDHTRESGSSCSTSWLFVSHVTFTSSWSGTREQWSVRCLQQQKLTCVVECARA